LMVEIGKAGGKKTAAVITDMDQPLGRAVGNSLEVIEAIETLKGKGPADITELSVRLAGIMAYIGEKAGTPEEGHKMALEALESGKALDIFKAFVAGQGGDERVACDYDLFPQSAVSMEIKSPKAGFVHEIKAKTIGLASQHAGAGRAEQVDAIDLSAGIYLNKKAGDPVSKGELLATVYGSGRGRAKAGAAMAEQAFTLGDKPRPKPPLIHKIIGLE